MRAIPLLTLKKGFFEGTPTSKTLLSVPFLKGETMPNFLCALFVPFWKGETMPNFFTAFLGRWCPLGRRNGSAPQPREVGKGKAYGRFHKLWLS